MTLNFKIFKNLSRMTDSNWRKQNKCFVIENNTLYISKYIFYHIKNLYYSDGMLKMYNYKIKVNYNIFFYFHFLTLIDEF